MNSTATSVAPRPPTEPVDKWRLKWMPCWLRACLSASMPTDERAETWPGQTASRLLKGREL
eukprot:10904473-Alexandrium_andersonii.AAC.1